MTKRNPAVRDLPVLLMTLGIAGALAACGGSSGGAPSAEDIDETPWEVRMESPLDTVAVTTYGETAENGPGTGSDSPDPPEGEEIPAPVLERPEVTETRTPVPDPQVFTPGWRVQIFASTSMASADSWAETARRKFSESVYVEYEPPMYKVRVGDFLTRRSADAMKTRVRSEEYEDAFVVEALVVRPS